MVLKSAEGESILEAEVNEKALINNSCLVMEEPVGEEIPKGRCLGN